MVFAPRRSPPPHLTFPPGATSRGRNRLPMGKIRGFLEIERRVHEKRPVEERLSDWREFELPVPDAELAEQAARCMDCGIPTDVPRRDRKSTRLNSSHSSIS